MGIIQMIEDTHHFVVMPEKGSKMVLQFIPTASFSWGGRGR
jgi:hypothetical protein